MGRLLLAYFSNIYEFQGFDFVKQVLTYILIFSLCSVGYSQSKEGTEPTIPVSFPDSIRIVLENTKHIEAQVIGNGFFTAWTILSIDQQQTIQFQTRDMRRKGYGLRPHILNYYSALVNGVNVERLSAVKLDEYLTLAQQVIEAYEPAKAAIFFKNISDFFQFHALNYEKPFRLYAVDDNYSFSFIAPPPTLSWDDPIETIEEVQEETSNDDWYSEEQPASLDDQPLLDEGYNDDYSSDAYEPAMPSWMTPPVQPYQEGPVINFDRITLNFVTPYDSVFLKNTKGTYSLLDKIFVGEGGSFDWSPAGLSGDSVYCNFTTYSLKANRPELEADLVKLNYVGKTPGLIPGTFEFKSQPRKDSVFSSYPRFVSYEATLEIQGIGNENVQYVGGFSLTGKKISSKSVSGDPATIRVSGDGQKKFSAKSVEFEFLDSAIVTQSARLAIYQGGDSITHPLAKFRYDFGKEQLIVQNVKGAMRNTPYSASFFNVDFSADVLRWDMKSDSLDIYTDGGRNIVPMVVESTEFYDEEDYRLLKGRGFSFHPLALVANYCLTKRVREFYSGDLAMFTKKDIGEIKMAIEFLAQKGMVTYSPRTDLVKVKDKAIELYKAYKGESDYDNLKIHSVIDSSANATLNFKRKYMTVRGVEEFKVSDSLNVRIQPDSSVITLLQDRDIQFDGTIHAGNFEISGKGFTLEYDSFYIQLSQIDSINFYVTEKNSKGQSIRRRVNNSMVGADSTAAAAGGLGDISRSSGTLFISRANNKSGKEKLPNYPRLDASTGGVIYFDRPEVLNGVYDRSMFFVVPPFKLDSLNDADPASINFEGTFVSSGMFPNFKEKLHTMPDKSLGFEHDIVAPGYQLYNGDATMNGHLSLNNRGLRGSGTIEYLAAKLEAPELVFYPDSVTGRGSYAAIKKEQFGSTLFPQAAITDYQIKWYPKQDQMNLKNLRDPFSFYDSSAQLTGEITISKNGVKGIGKLDTRGTELLSKDMNFTGTSFGARHAKFKVNSKDPKKPLLYGNDIRLNFNLEENYADISPEIEGVAAITFPFAEVKTSMPNTRWDLDMEKIIMTKNPDAPLENSYFYSTREELDSLAFNAERAEYDLKTQELKVSGIPYIIVADAKITPENNEVLILENSKIGTLTNTTIVVDTLNGYHRLTEGVVDIKSRNEFSGYATYQYVNFLNDTFAIKMTDFHLEAVQETESSKRSQRDKSEATVQTVANGAVSEKDNLVLGAGMFYKGDMTMYATRPALQLNGFVKLDIKKIKDYKTWIQYSQTGDETEVLIDFDNALNEDGAKVDAGLHFSALDRSLYISFLNDKRSEDDEDLFVPSGTLYYDKDTREYKIEDRAKAAGTKLSGKVFSYNDENLQVRFEGPINLFNGNKDFNITASSIGSGNLETNEIRMNSFLMVDSNIPSGAFDIMALDLIDVIKTEGADEGLGDQTELLYKIADLVGERVVKDYEQRSLQGYVPLTSIPALVRPMVFSNVNLKWSQEHQAFYSEGNLGVSNILRHDINGMFEGFMEIKKSEDGGSIFNVFFKASPDSWYFFGFEGSRILVHSSNNNFNTTIGKKTNAGKAKIGEVAFVPGSDEETLAFINRFRDEYYGIEVPYSLSAGSSATPQTEEEAPTIRKDDDGF